MWGIKRDANRGLSREGAYRGPVDRGVNARLKRETAVNMGLSNEGF